MNSKDTLDFLLPFSEVATSFRAVTIPGEKNSLTSKDLADEAGVAGLVAHSSANTIAALGEIRALGREPVRVLICGSLYLAGEVLALNSEAADAVENI